jgi:hypothetical protein
MGDSKTGKRNDQTFRPPRTRAIRALNDLYVLAGLSSQALLEMQKRVTENDDGDDVEFEAPAANGETTIVTRDASQLSKLLHLASARGVYEQLLVTGVAVTEDYLQGVLKTVFRWFPEKLNLSADGKQAEKTVALGLVIKSVSIDEILDTVIQKQLLAVFYGPPERYFDYIESVLSIKIEKSLRTSFAEIKATRDVIVHNSGVANEVYMSKAGEEARGEVGEHLTIDSAYFKSAIHTMKRLTHGIYSETMQKFGNHVPRSKGKPTPPVTGKVKKAK